MKNPIGLARAILDETTKPLTLQRVPPNLLVGQGALDFAANMGVITVFNDFLVSKGAKERWNKWKKDLDYAEERESRDYSRRTEVPARDTPISVSSRSSLPASPLSTTTSSSHTRVPTPNRALVASTADVPGTYYEPEKANSTKGFNISSPLQLDPMQAIDPSQNIDGYRPIAETATDESPPWAMKRRKLNGNQDGSFDDWQSPLGKLANMKMSHPGNPLQPPPSPQANDQPRDTRPDHVTDTVGAIAIDAYGNIAAGSSSGGIGMKHRGRCGPAALVGIGAYVIPASPDDHDETCVATVTSGTGEHMATTLAAATAAERIYSSVRKTPNGRFEICTEEEALQSLISREFMEHPGVKNSHCAGAIGLLAVRKTKHGIALHFAHNTDSFAVASMHSGDKKPNAVMSRSNGNGSIAQGGRMVRNARVGTRV